MIESEMFSSLTKWSSSKSCSILFVLLAIWFSGTAQILQTKRFEVNISSDEDNFEIIPASTAGLYLTRRTGAIHASFIQIVKLDTAFQQTWSGFLPIDFNYSIVGKKTLDKKLYLLSKSTTLNKNDLLLYEVDEESGLYKLHRIRSYIPFSPSEFQVTKQSILVGGYFNQVPFVIYYNLEDKKTRVLPGLFNESGELNQIRIYDDNSFDVLISARNQLRQNTIWLKSYDAGGNMLVNYPLQPEPNSNLLFGRSLKTNAEHQLIAGVFGNRNKEYSKGMFIASIDASGLQNLRYYHFGDLKNFFKYMKAKREQRVKERIERKRIKGKRARFNYRFLVHELVFHNNQYILLGEAFYPRYQNIDPAYNSGFFTARPGAQSIQRGRVFDGYVYTHAVVMGFDENGKLLWDNSFEINDVKTFTLEQFVKLQVHDDKISLVYLYQNQIRTKIIKDDQVLEGKTSDPIKTFGVNEVVKKEEDSKNKLEYWYDDYLFAYGTQEVVSKPGNAVRRKVFFINKLTFEK
jgi:hypothetical protein